MALFHSSDAPEARTEAKNEMGAGVSTSPHSSRVRAPAPLRELACLSLRLSGSSVRSGASNGFRLPLQSLVGRLPLCRVAFGFGASAPAHRLRFPAVPSADPPLPFPPPFGLRFQHQLCAVARVAVRLRPAALSATDGKSHGRRFAQSGIGLWINRILGIRGGACSAPDQRPDAVADAGSWSFGTPE